MNTLVEAKWQILGPRVGKRVPCRCSCGVERQVVESDIRRGRSRNCGCENRARLRLMKPGLRHGMEKTAEYRIWVDMRRRCHNPNRPDFPNYGGRGIYVCDRWRNDFSAFYSDMGPRPPGTTLDRIDNAGPYDAANCVWASRVRQERNKRTSRVLTLFGERMTMADAAERYGIKYHTLVSRIDLRGWEPERAVTEPVTPRSGSTARRSARKEPAA